MIIQKKYNFSNPEKLFTFDSVDDFITKMSFFSFGVVYLLIPLVTLIWIIRNENEIREQFLWYRIQ